MGNEGDLAILASDEKGASRAEMDAGDIRDIKNNAKKKTYYIGEVTGPLFSVKTRRVHSMRALPTRRPPLPFPPRM